MDSFEDSDIQLSLSGPEVLRELQNLLPSLLFHAWTGSQGRSKTRLRYKVNTKRLEHLLLRLDFFQELPQLLDPALAELLRPLTIALPQCMHLVKISRERPTNGIAVSVAVCKLLYAFCKIRGHKVIIRFFSNEVAHIAPLVEALEMSCRMEDTSFACWEEKYILLLWLSHLVLNPFPLSTIGTKSESFQAVVDLPWSMPGSLFFVHRICALALFSLSSASKERDSAVILLTRLALRPDLDEAHLFDKMMSWSVQAIPRLSADQSVYKLIGILSLLTAIFKSAKPVSVTNYILPLYENIQVLYDKGDGKAGSSATVRKLIVKIWRSMVICADYIAHHDVEESYRSFDGLVIENAIGNLLSSLSDSDSPVRFAASKSISTVTMKLQAEMAEELVDAIVSSVEEDVDWPEDDFEYLKGANKGPRRYVNLESVNPFRWQGLILTLSYLLFHRAVSLRRLPSVLECLLLALSFEQRTTAGSSTGNIVRDAANFGIWSLARRYSTAEIQEMDINRMRCLNSSEKSVTVLQSLACELIATACLDPLGNVRRGASAALQELVGRHPDIIIAGIDIIQIVDYHAVALYTRAATIVTLKVARISTIYQKKLLQDILTWRGIFAVSPSSRIQAAITYGHLAENEGVSSIAAFVSGLWKEVEKLQPRDVSRRHGLLIALAELVAAFGRVWSKDNMLGTAAQNELSIFVLWKICSGTQGTDEKHLTDFSLRPALTAEAICYLLRNLCEFSIKTGSVRPPHAILPTAARLIEFSINVSHASAIEQAASAAAAYLSLCKLIEQPTDAILSQWFNCMDRSLRSGPGRQSSLPGWYVLLGSVFDQLDTKFHAKACNLFLLGLGSLAEIDTKVASLENLHFVFRTSSELHYSLQLLMTTKSCLKDYTTDQRGDVGSLVRIAALRCIATVSELGLDGFSTETPEIEGLVCGLAVEKLDKVRITAHECLLSMRFKHRYSPTTDVHSAAYFESMLSYANRDHILNNLLLCLSTTISAASHSVSQSSRTGFEHFLASADEDMLIRVLDSFILLLRSRLQDERTIVSLLDTTAFALETNTFSTLCQSERAIPKFKSIFALVQKAHLKTANLAKILAAIEVYAYLSTVTCVRIISVRKLVNLLLHPFPAVRQSAAESLFCNIQDEALLPIDWTSPPKYLKPYVKKLEDKLIQS